MKSNNVNLKVVAITTILSIATWASVWLLFPPYEPFEMSAEDQHDFEELITQGCPDMLPAYEKLKTSEGKITYDHGHMILDECVITFTIIMGPPEIVEPIIDGYNSDALLDALIEEFSRQH